MSDNPPPVPCPKCAERQNVSPGAFDPDDRAFHVHCMSCGHRFSPVEYKMSMAAVMNEPPKGLAAKAGGRPPAGGPGPGPGPGDV